MTIALPRAELLNVCRRMFARVPLNCRAVLDRKDTVNLRARLRLRRAPPVEHRNHPPFHPHPRAHRSPRRTILVARLYATTHLGAARHPRITPGGGALDQWRDMSGLAESESPRMRLALRRRVTECGAAKVSPARSIRPSSSPHLHRPPRDPCPSSC